MKRVFPSLLKGSSFILFLAVLFFYSCDAPSEPPRVLVFSKTAGYRHASIPKGQEAIRQLGAKNGFLVDTTEDAGLINEENLQQYAAVIFLSTTGDVLDDSQEADFQRYIQAGRGFVGIHAATDTEYHWGWFNRLVGAQFASHPEIQEAHITCVDSTHASTRHVPHDWVRTDEWYNFKNLYSEINVLLNLDETTYSGGENGEEHPIAWYHEYDGGRAWYTALGHTDESYEEEDFLQHLLGGIQYAIGENKPYQQENITAQRRPENNRVERTMLIEGQLTEPTEFTILPNLDMLVVERRGEIKHYSSTSKQLRTLGKLEVYSKAEVEGVNAEEGLMGIQISPDFAETGHVFMYYSPADISVNRLSRFTFRGDSLDFATEKMILEVSSDRNICCHTGGSIAFSGDGKYLFLSTGDNSTPFDESGQRFVNKGYAPLDERPGHEPYDARRSSGNTNDLRGKILRIEVQADGSYTIPAGNLFPEGTPKTRPEIYVMGNRNPYRISVDAKNGNLYWGEVGPDARIDNTETRGPRGYDEVNQAKAAGFFGWPLFVGNNYAYHQYNYHNGVTGVAYDPLAPINDSRNNTGLQELPPAQPAFIWYPYAESDEFPAVGSGGRNAMAGPVYYPDLYPEATRYPDYYKGKLFIYDWIRNWILLTSMHEDGSLDKLEPFLPEETFNNIIDMEVGPDGLIYLLEYGSGWFSRNPDAGISRIDFYAGNRPPQIDSIFVNKLSGKLPFALEAELLVSDPEGQSLSYEWQVGYEVYETTEPRLALTLEEEGNYQVSCRVKDVEGALRKSETLLVYAGNEAPTVEVFVEGNQDIYFKGEPITYRVAVADDDTVINENLMVQTKYTQDVKIAGGHLQGLGDKVGESIIASLDCASCHKEREKSIGPSYQQIANRYRDEQTATAYLSEKIIRGGGGVWGEAAMAPHPTISPSEAALIVEWIMSVDAPASTVASLPANGTIIGGNPTSWESTLQLWATYTDVPQEGIKPLTTSVAKVLRDNYFNVNEWDQGEGFRKGDWKEIEVWELLPQDGWLKIPGFDLTSVEKVGLDLFVSDSSPLNYSFELRSGSPEGPVLASWKDDGSGRKNDRLHLESLLDKEVKVATDEPFYLVSKILAAGDSNIRVAFGGVGVMSGN